MFFSRLVSSTILAGLIAASPADAAGPDNSPDSACALAKEAPAEAVFSLPFRTIDGRIYLDVMVNGEGPFVFALDTGASGMGRADATLAAALNLPADGTDETSDGVSSAQVDKVRIASVALGGLDISFLRLTVKADTDELGNNVCRWKFTAGNPTAANYFGGSWGLLLNAASCDWRTNWFPLFLKHQNVHIILLLERLLKLFSLILVLKNYLELNTSTFNPIQVLRRIWLY